MYYYTTTTWFICRTRNLAAIIVSLSFRRNGAEGMRRVPCGDRRMWVTGWRSGGDCGYPLDRGSIAIRDFRQNAVTRVSHRYNTLIAPYGSSMSSPIRTPVFSALPLSRNEFVVSVIFINIRACYAAPPAYRQCHVRNDCATECDRRSCNTRRCALMYNTIFVRTGEKNNNTYYNKTVTVNPTNFRNDPITRRRTKQKQPNNGAAAEHSREDDNTR